MPPEVVQDKPVYTERIDCFSFGAIIIQMLTWQFPNPGDRHDHPGLPTGSVLVEVSEVNRVDKTTSAKSIQTTPFYQSHSTVWRIRTANVLQLISFVRVAELKEMPEYKDSAGSDKDERLLQLEKDQILQEKDKEIKEKEMQLEEKEKRLGRVNQLLPGSKWTSGSSVERRIAELEQQLSEREQQKTRASFELIIEKGWECVAIYG